MSIRTITTLAVERNTRTLSRGDAGVAVENAPDASDNAKVRDILAKTVPTTLVTAYTGYIAVVSEWVKDPTPELPNPPDLLLWRWAGFAVLVISAAALTYSTYIRKAGGGSRKPYPEVAAVTVAAIGWGLALPESPLLISLPNESPGQIVVGFITFVTVGINAFLSNIISKPAT